MIMSKYFVEEISHSKRIFLESSDDVVEGYICIETPILCPWPVNFYSQYEYNYVDYKPILDSFVDIHDPSHFFDVPIWLNEKDALFRFKNLRDAWWAGGKGSKTNSWAVVKVAIDKDLITNVFRFLDNYSGRAWPLGVFCPVVYCLEYIFHGIGSRPDIMESREEQEKWNVKSMDKTASKKEIFNKKKKN